ncbi:MAG: hypothetical protein AB1505_02285 [Candidatus Latescibacterota bacterium]
MERSLRRQLVGHRSCKEVQAFLRQRLPRLQPPRSRTAWLQRAQRTRRRVLEVFLRGHPPGLLAEKPGVEWGEVLTPSPLYRIRKLRYEGYPEMWIPALLYEPVPLPVRAPVVLNPNGHHAGGKAMGYKQARCINLAKRGVLALNTEFIGMGELRADVEHNRIGHLDLCGVAGIGVFYLAMKRGLDVLLGHPSADAERVAMTGLSGGGWQTAVLSALDERIRLIVPVAGHSPIWQRVGCVSDIGDLEQDPSDLGTVADFDVLTALFAPRPTLLIYNRNDDCCFQTRRTRLSVYRPVKPYFALLGAADRLAFHDNVDPGTHNYELDNRTQFYAFLGRHFGLRASALELPWQEEVLSESELAVGLPPDNATLLSLAQHALRQAHRARAGRPQLSPARARRRLARLVNLPEYARVEAEAKGLARRVQGATVRQWILHLDDVWSLPVTEFTPPAARGVEVVVGDGGRKQAAGLVRQGVAAGRRVVAADLLGTGELPATWQCHMLVATTGERSLGILAAQLRALLRWAAQDGGGPPHLQVWGQVVPVVALVAAAVQPAEVGSITASGMLDSLSRLIDWPVPYASAAPLFCFGLLREFDIPDLIELSAPVPVQEAGRGPLRRRA